MLNKLLIHKYPKEDYNILAYFPDFLPYDFTAETYKNYLKGIFNQVNKNKPLMVDGFELKTVSKMRYYWESFKGFLGFNNPCDSNRVALQTIKLIYWGYLKGYFLYHDISTVLNYTSVDSIIIEKSREPVNESSSGVLQNFLCHYFLITKNTALQEYLRINKLPDIKNYRFGEIYLKFNSLRELVEIDSANVDIQNALMQHPQFLSLCENFPEQFRQKYAKKLAGWVNESIKKLHQNIFSAFFTNFWNSNINKDQLRCAYMLDNTVIKQYPDIYIDLFLKNKSFQDAWNVVESMDDASKACEIVIYRFILDECYQCAPVNTEFSLLIAGRLMKIDKSNIKKAIKLAPFQMIREYPDLALPILVEQEKWQEVYFAIETISKNDLAKSTRLLGQYFNTNERLTIIRSDSNLVRNFAQYWVDKSKEAQNGNWLGVFGRQSYNTKTCLEYALILNHNIDILEAELYFDEYCRQKKWDDAYSLVFSKSVDTPQNKLRSIPENKIQKLADQLSKLGEESYEKGLSARNHGQFYAAEEEYQQSFTYKMRAYNLNNSIKYNKDRVIHERLLVQCKFDRACHENSIDLNKTRDLLLRLEKSNNYLPNQTVDEEYIPAKFNILYKKMSLLRESLAQAKPDMFESLDAKDIKSLYNFDLNVASELIQTIKELLLLSKNMNPPLSNAKLGYLHFLLAEVMELQDNLGELTKDIQDNYYLAAQLVPNNLYFVKKVFETSECSSEREGVYHGLSRKLLQEWGYDNEKYSLWCKERWLKSECRPHKDIIQPEDLSSTVAQLTPSCRL